jgi:hypothetical protein
LLEDPAWFETRVKDARLTMTKRGAIQDPGHGAGDRWERREPRTGRIATTDQQ